MSVAHLLGLVLFVAFVAGCPANKSAPLAAPSDAAPAPSASVDAAAPLTDAGAPRDAVRNLLHYTDAEITLSSRVDNPRDYPEHLVDGKQQTAWNGKTGDKNAWIEVKLDPRVHVESLAITAGFDKGALFEQNLRITKLRVERDGEWLLDASLDPTLRTPQRIVVDQPGGTLKLTVIDTVRGTNPSWQEIVVSELMVLGTAPKELLLPEPKLPRITVAKGSATAPSRFLQPSDLTFEGRSGTTAQEICSAWKKELMALIVAAQKGGLGFDGYDEKSVVCTEITAPALEGVLPDGWSLPAAVKRAYFDGVAHSDERYLALRRNDGTIVVGPEYAYANDIGDSGYPLASRVAVVKAGSGPALLVASVSISPYTDGVFPDGGAGPGTTWRAEHEGRVCRFLPMQTLCDERILTIFRKQTLDGAARAAFEKAPKVDLPPLDSKTGKMHLEDAE